MLGGTIIYQDIRMLRSLLICLLLSAVTQMAVARDFENNYAVYGAGGDSCGMYLKSMKKGGKELDYFIDWTIGYLAAFNVIMPSTYDVLGETDFPAAQMWLERHCKRYPKEPFITAVIRLTGVLYPMRYQSSLKEKPVKTKPVKIKPAVK